MPTALLTGSRPATSRLNPGLRASGADILVADSRDGIATLTRRLPRRSVGAYVQFPMEINPTSSWLPAVTERLETLALVAPLLAPDAAVVLVADAPADPARDQRVAEGLQLIAEASLSTCHRLRTRVTVHPDAAPDAIRRAITGQGISGHGAVPLADLGADRDYADWRTDILNLTSLTDATFFGWRNQEGGSRVGVLRGSVLSPLLVSPEDWGGWGTERGASALGRAVIAAAVGGRTVDDGLVELFVKEVIGPLDTTGFELSAADVERWVRRHLAGPMP